MKPDKVLCCMFLLAILGYDHAKKPDKMVMRTPTPNQKKRCKLFNSYIDKEVK